MDIRTLAVHAGERVPGPDGSVVFPVFHGTLYSVPEGTGYHDLAYPRLSSTPSQRYLHDKLAALEGAEAAVATASGMAAITTTLLALLRPGDHVIALDGLYGGTYDFLREHAGELGWECSYVDPTDPARWDRAWRTTTRLFYVETITNPLIRVPLLADVVAFCRDRGLRSVIDNTFATPVNFRPLEAGFDLVCHSATKYLNGHSDVVAGCVMGSDELVGAVRHHLNHFGGALDAYAGAMLARGLKTLALRVAAHNANATALAAFLSAHPAVAEVHHPSLPTHPDHDHASKLLSGFGGMLSMRLTRPAAARVASVLSALRLAANTPSLGGVETLVTQPARTSHAGLPAAERERLGIGEDLVRVSVGVEGPDDLVADFARALEQAA
jgi:cystathionine beta-lyase/cystathionine gamma-synthase